MLASHDGLFKYTEGTPQGISTSTLRAFSLYIFLLPIGKRIYQYCPADPVRGFSSIEGSDLDPFKELWSQKYDGKSITTSIRSNPSTSFFFLAGNGAGAEAEAE
jgi:hypothetical protein